MLVPVRLLTAFAATASLAFGALPASSADLYEPDRADAPYYDDGYSGEETYARQYEDGARDYDPPYRGDGTIKGPKSFDESAIYSKTFREPPYRAEARYEERCVPRRVARWRLREDGWRGIRLLRARRGVFLTRARSPSGRLFKLTLDRCTGDILDARPLRARYYDEFAYNRPEWRWRD